MIYDLIFSLKDVIYLSSLQKKTEHFSTSLTTLWKALDSFLWQFNYCESQTKKL